ncbi:MAG: acyl-CoA synthetase [Alphaproteobacteria bacterium]
MSRKILSGDREIAVDQTLINAARAASGFEALGLQPGDAVATYLRNDFANFEVNIAAGLLGVYAVPINWHLSAEETGYILEDCGARALVVHADLLKNIAAGIPEGIEVFVVETPPEIAAAYGLTASQTEPSPGAVLWSEWTHQFDIFEPRDIASPGAMIYTSGTTGRPKGVRRKPQSPDEMDELFRVINTAFGLRPGARTIIPAPMYHSAPNSYSSLSIRQELDEIVLMPRFDPEDLLRLIEKHEITHLQTVPTMFVRLLKLDPEIRSRYDVSSLEHVVHAAAPISPEVKEAMIEWWGPIINEYYGSTETGSVVFCTAEDWLGHRGTVGRPMPGVELRILDDDGNDQPVGVPGDVYVRITRGPDFTYNNDDAKRKKAERHGLIAPGDIGYVDKDGFLYLCDRRNDMVISGGVNIYPAEIEGCLINHPEIADCAVFGIPDEEFGESLAAYIQPRPGAGIGEDEVRAHVREHLAAYKVPRVVELVDDLPREDSGKIFKRKLRAPYWEGRERQI